MKRNFVILMIFVCGISFSQDITTDFDDGYPEDMEWTLKRDKNGYFSNDKIAFFYRLFVKQKLSNNDWSVEFCFYQNRFLVGFGGDNKTIMFYFDEDQFNEFLEKLELIYSDVKSSYLYKTMRVKASVKIGDSFEIQWVNITFFDNVEIILPQADIDNTSFIFYFKQTDIKKIIEKCNKFKSVINNYKQ